MLDAAGNTTYADDYDAAGNLLRIRDPKGNPITIGYDELNRENSRTDANGNVWLTKYDLAGNVIERSAPGNPRLVTTYGYDLGNQLISILLPGTATAITFDYDNNGNRTQMVDATGTTLYEYDAVNRLTKVTDPQSKVVGFRYDAASNRASIIYPNGQSVTYGYDGAERMTSVAPWVGGTTTYTLDKSGRV